MIEAEKQLEEIQQKLRDHIRAEMDLAVYIALLTDQAILAPTLAGEIRRLREAIQAHRDQRGDNRCWLDDLQLYVVLGEGDPEQLEQLSSLPPKSDFLASCERFWEQRQCPERRGETLMPAQMTIQQLTDRIAELESLNAKGNRGSGDGD